MHADITQALNKIHSSMHIKILYSMQFSDTTIEMSACNRRRILVCCAVLGRSVPLWSGWRLKSAQGTDLKHI